MAEEKKQTKAQRRNRLKPLSLHPLTPEQALGAFMRVKPKPAKSLKRTTQKKKPE